MSLVPFRGNMPDLTETSNDQSNLRISVRNMGKEAKCGKCVATIKDCVCFCKECKRLMHPRTSSVIRFFQQNDRAPHKLMKDNEHRLIHESDRGHEMIKEENIYKTTYGCSGCKEKGFGPHYSCKSPSCSFRLHPECKSLCTTIVHQFFPKKVFSFSSSPTFNYCDDCKKSHSTISCSACGMDVNGYFFRSLDGRKHLHPCCATLLPSFECREGGVTMVLQPKTTANCQLCGKTKVNKHNKRTAQIWSYESVSDKDIQVHVQCIMKLLSDPEDHTAGGTVVSNGSHPKLSKVTRENGATDLEIQIADPDAQKKWEKRFKTVMKYVKIVLREIIAGFLANHPIPILIKTAVGLVARVI